MRRSQNNRGFSTRFKAFLLHLHTIGDGAIITRHSVYTCIYVNGYKNYLYHNQFEGGPTAPNVYLAILYIFQSSNIGLQTANIAWIIVSSKEIRYKIRGRIIRPTKNKNERNVRKTAGFFLLFFVIGIFFRELKNLNKSIFRQSVLPLLRKTTKHTLAKMKSFYKDLKTRRVLGFKCDLKKCDSTLMECSMRACKKKSMVFGESSHSYAPKMTDPSISDTSTISSASEKAREF